MLEGACLQKPDHVKERDKIRFAGAVISDQDVERLDLDILISNRLESSDPQTCKHRTSLEPRAVYRFSARVRASDP